MSPQYEYAKAMGFPSQRPEVKRQGYRARAAEIRERVRERYATDPEFRERKLASNRARYNRIKAAQ